VLRTYVFTSKTGIYIPFVNGNSQPVTRNPQLGLMNTKLRTYVCEKKVYNGYLFLSYFNIRFLGIIYFCKMVRYLGTFIFCLSQFILFGQFPPAADQVGTTAIHKDSSIFVNWAKTAIIERGEQNISDDSLNFAEIGEPVFATGITDNQTVSLGDNGYAILTFDPPITNKNGADFAVFENGFPTQGGYFLELAFVEVSSDGVNFVRFPATSLSDTTKQLSTFDLVNPTDINNLAGKYVGGFGTPFDLEELVNISQLDISKISHVKIVDVVGSIEDSLATFDAAGRKVNDPFPTPFPSGGFDLDAVGVIHQQLPTSVESLGLENGLLLYPNPLQVGQHLNLQPTNGDFVNSKIELFSANGILLSSNQLDITRSILPFSFFSKGVYFLIISHDEQSIVKKIVVE